jgi:hypothetical protein
LLLFLLMSLAAGDAESEDMIAGGAARTGV